MSPPGHGGAGDNPILVPSLERKWEAESLKFAVCSKELGVCKAWHPQERPGTPVQGKNGEKGCSAGADPETLPGRSARGAARLELMGGRRSVYTLWLVGLRESRPSLLLPPQVPSTNTCPGPGAKPNTWLFHTAYRSRVLVNTYQWIRRARHPAERKKDSYPESCFYS